MLRNLVRAALALLLTAPAGAAAQNPAMPAVHPEVSPALVTACVQAQQQTMTAADAANRRLELARQTNQPAAMRAAMDDLQVVLSSMRTQLAPCATLEAAAAPAAGGMAGHDMRTMSSGGPASLGTPVMQPGSPAAADPHAGMVMPAAQARPAAAGPARGAAPAGKPAAAPADPHAGMVMPAPATPASSTATLPAPATSTDSLKCPRQVDPKTALRVLHQGRMYYFCSEQDRAAFVKDPAKYRTAPAEQAAPAPAHGH